MTRKLSQAALQASFAEETSSVFVTLLDFNFAGFHVRVINDWQNVTSGGNVYYGYPFIASPPSDTEGSPPQARLILDNVDQAMFSDGSKAGIIAHFREMTDEVPVALSIAMRDTPSDIEVGPYPLHLREIAHNQLTIEGILAPEPIWDESFPSFAMTPFYCPGLFRQPQSRRGDQRDPRLEKDALKGYPKDDTGTPILRRD